MTEACLVCLMPSIRIPNQSFVGLSSVPWPFIWCFYLFLIQEPRMEAWEPRELLQRAGSYWCGGPLGSRFWPAHYAHGGPSSWQVGSESLRDQHHSALRVPKGWASVDLSEVLGDAEARATIKPCELLRLHPLVSTGFARSVESAIVSFFVNLRCTSLSFTAVFLIEWRKEIKVHCHSLLNKSIHYFISTSLLG